VTEYRDRRHDRYSFRRWEADLRQYLTFVKDTRTIAICAWTSSARPEAGDEVPFYLQPTLGGGRTLRGYRTFRFRDRTALLLQGEYRWRINQFVQGALFYDTGAVGSTLDDLGAFERSYGLGLRAGGRTHSAFRIEMAFGGREGNRLLVRFDDAF
jgi:outer membrane protein assembly factor BamA